MMELLAPAGNLNAALAAFDSGADAVYAGLKKFNARERSVNFTPDEMGRLVNYAHAHGRRVYLTFNTLVKESELPDAVNALAEIASLRPDAVIVQDVGICAILRECFPELAVHASTQMAVHDSRGALAAAKMGVKRIILERETTLEEIELFTKRSPLETEVFIHGALCCSLSGSCLFSSWLGGASGNRGRCRQPCRGFYRDAENRAGYFLSTHDLCGLELIPFFRKCGISALKIEGRLRAADYVSSVVKAYRLALDASEADFPEALREARAILAETCSREPSLGYYTEQSEKNLIQSQARGAVGKQCGTVKDVSKNSFRVLLSDRIHVGDNLRVQPKGGGDGPALSVLDLRVGGAPVMKAFPGTVCSVGTKAQIPADGIVYRIGTTFDSMEKRIANLPPFRPELDFSIELTGRLLRVWNGLAEWSAPLELAKAETNPVTAEILEKAFTFPPDYPFRTGNLSVRVEPGLFLPQSVLKGLRGEFREFLRKRLTAEEVVRIPFGRAAAFLKEYAAVRPMPFKPETSTLDPETVLPFFLPETRLGELDEFVKRRIAEGKTVFRATALSHLILKERYPQITLKVYPPLPAANSFAVREMKRLGADSVLLHIELEKSEIERTAAKTVLPLEILRYGRPVILATRAFVPAHGDFLMNGDGRRFLLKREGVLTILLPETPLVLPEMPGIGGVFDYRSVEPGLPGFEFNFTRGWS